MKKIFKKILEKIQFMLLLIWLLGVPAVTLLVSGIEEDSDLGRSAGRLFFLWLVITVFVGWFIGKSDEIKKKKYREKNISEVVIENTVLGKIVFEYNKEEDEMISKSVEKTCEIDEVRINSWSKIDKEVVFKNLEKLYNDREKIINDYCREFYEHCDDWDEEDPDGNKITLECVKENFSISWVELYENEIVLWGGLPFDCLGGHDVIATINCSTNEIRYDLIG